MSYRKTEWSNGKTPLNQTNMNNIENGISQLDTQKYEKPQTGIPITDLSNEVQDSLNNANSAVQTVCGLEPDDNGDIGLDADNTQSVSYTKNQNLSLEQKELARENINAATPSGDYANDGLVALKSRISENLIDNRAQPVQANFTYRTTAGNQSVFEQDEGHSVATIEKILGNSVAWQQLINKGDFPHNTDYYL